MDFENRNENFICMSGVNFMFDSINRFCTESGTELFLHIPVNSDYRMKDLLEMATAAVDQYRDKIHIITE